jgi:hypothetical protein
VSPPSDAWTKLISGPSSPPPPATGSLLSSAASVAAAAGRRATSAASPSKATAASSDDGPRTEINCVEGYDKNIYIGRSDGIVEWWVIDGNAGDTKVREVARYELGNAYSQNNGWTLRHKHTLFPRRAVSKIILLPKVSKCFILSGKSRPAACDALVDLQMGHCTL